MLGPAGAHGCQVGAAFTASDFAFLLVSGEMGESSWVVWKSWQRLWVLLV